MSFNKFYTITQALGAIVILSQLLISFRYLNLPDMVLFLVLIAVFVLGFIYSLGFFGGKERGYGFSRFINIISIFTIFFAMLSEIEVYLYLRGFTNMVTIVLIQVFLIIIVSGVLKFAVLNHPYQSN
ncbi:MAG: hypothetical protein ACYCSO_05745 [Cuniculiplasma sp.]